MYGLNPIPYWLKQAQVVLAFPTLCILPVGLLGLVYASGGWNAVLVAATGVLGLSALITGAIAWAAITLYRWYR